MSETYLSLGNAQTGASLIKDEGFTGCRAPIQHPICNFAIDLKLDPWSARRLAALAAEQRTFFVYNASSDQPEHVSELLERVGFRCNFELKMMIAEREEAPTSVELVRAETDVERLDLARFMSEQFFIRQNAAFKRIVADATARAHPMDLYAVWSGRQRVAAVMLMESESIGVYNLCVDPSVRGVGWGSATVQAILAMPTRRGRLVTLQCDTRLESWYDQLGFEKIGAVRVYDLAELKQADILF